MSRNSEEKPASDFKFEVQHVITNDRINKTF